MTDETLLLLSGITVSVTLKHNNDCRVLLNIIRLVACFGVKMRFIKDCWALNIMGKRQDRERKYNNEVRQSAVV